MVLEGDQEISGEGIDLNRIMDMTTILLNNWVVIISLLTENKIKTRINPIMVPLRSDAPLWEKKRGWRKLWVTLRNKQFLAEQIAANGITTRRGEEKPLLFHRRKYMYLMQ